jgi:hypothetical protein
MRLCSSRICAERTAALFIINSKTLRLGPERSYRHNGTSTTLVFKGPHKLEGMTGYKVMPYREIDYESLSAVPVFWKSGDIDAKETLCTYRMRQQIPGLPKRLIGRIQ